MFLKPVFTDPAIVPPAIREHCKGPVEPPRRKWRHESTKIHDFYKIFNLIFQYFKLISFCSEMH